MIHRATLTLLAAALCLSAPVASGGDAPAGGEGFSDDFSDASLDRFTIKGPVAIEGGRLALGPGDGLAFRKAKAGPFAEAVADLELPAPPDPGRAETQFGFVYANGDQYFTVALERTRRGDGVEGKARVVLQAKDAAGKFQPRELSGAPLPQGPLDGRWVVRHRHGLVRVEHAGHLVIQADTRNRAGGLSMVFLAQRAGVARCSKWELASTPAPGDMGDAERAELARLNHESTRLYLAGRVEQGIQRLVEAIELGRSRFGDRHELTINMQLRLASFRHFQGDQVAGATLGEAALNDCIALYGEEHPRTAEALVSVGQLALYRHDFATARALLDRAGKAVDATLGPGSREAAAVLVEAASLDEDLSDHAAAQSRLERALAIQSARLGPDHADAIKTVTRLARVFRRSSRYGAALPLLEGVVASRRRTLGDGHPDTADALSELGYVLRYLHEFGRARAAYEEALAIRRKSSGEESNAVAASEDEMGGLCREAGDFAGALHHYERALAIRRKILDEDDVMTGTIHYAIGMMLGSDLRQDGPAKVHLEEALRIFRKRRGVDDPGGITVLLSLSELRGRHRDFAGARALVDEVIAIKRAKLGEAHPELADMLSILGYSLVDSRDFEAARGAFERSLAIRRGAFGEDHPDLAGSLIGLASVHRELRQFAEARPLIDRAIAIRRKALGEGHPELADALLQLSDLMREAGDFAAARPPAGRALAIRRGAYGDRHVKVAADLITVGSLESRLGHFEAARKLLDEALEIDRAAYGDEHPATGYALGQAGNAAFMRADYPTARAYAEQSLSIRRAYYGEEHPDVASAYHDLGIALTVRDEPSRARAALESALAIRVKLLGEDDPDTAATHHALADLLSGFGDWSTVRSHYERALLTRRKACGERHPDTAESLRGLGLARSVMGDPAGARADVEAALRVQEATLGRDHPEVGRTLILLAQLRGLGNDLDGARSDAERSLAIARRAYGERHGVTASAWGKLGQVEQARKDYPAARRCFEAALSIDREVLGAGSREALFHSGNVAWLGFLEKDYPRATRDLERYLPLWVGSTSDVLAGLSEAEALAFVEDNFLGTGLLSSYRNLPPDSAMPADGVYRALCATRGQATRLLASRRALAQGDAATRPDRERLAWVRGRLAELALSGIAPGDVPASLRAELVALNREKEGLERGLARPPAGPDAPEARRPASIGPEDLADRLPPGVAIVEFAPAQVATPPAGPGQEGGFAWHYEAFVTRRGVGDGDDRDAIRLDWVHLGPAEPLARAATEFRRAIADPDRRDVAACFGPDSPGRLLRRGLWDPIAPLVGGSPTVIIIPDDTLTRVPWAALPGRASGTFLVEDHALATVGLLDRLHELLGRGPAGGVGSLLVGGVDYDRASSTEAGPGALASTRGPAMAPGRRPEWAGLEGSRSEVRALASVAPDRAGVQVLEGTSATEAEVARRMRGRRFVHLATHGFFADEAFRSAFRIDPGREKLLLGGVELMGRRATVTSRNPLILSGVVLAGANAGFEGKGGGTRPGGDGILTAEEVSTLELEGTELVVLSACETGLGEVGGGEGVFGLQRAFGLAGVRSVIASLWKVDDSATQALMSEFYRDLWHPRPGRPAGKLAALRRAQLAMIAGYDPEAAGRARGVGGVRPAPAPARGPLPPFYWAAFGLDGDWR